jgi:uncharacterized protein
VPDDDAIIDLLTTTTTWAVVGASPDPRRPSHRVAHSLQGWGFRVVPVNPECGVIPADVGVEVVDVFRRSEHAGRHVDEAVAMGARGVWLQLGVVDEAAAARARRAGLAVVMDRCPAIEYPRLPA